MHSKSQYIPITAQFFTPLYFACTSNACLVYTECIPLYYIVDPASQQSNIKFKVWSFVLVYTNKNSTTQGNVIQLSRYSKDICLDFGPCCLSFSFLNNAKVVLFYEICFFPNFCIVFLSVKPLK